MHVNINLYSRSGMLSRVWGDCRIITHLNIPHIINRDITFDHICALWASVDASTRIDSLLHDYDHLSNQPSSLLISRMCQNGSSDSDTTLCNR